MNTCKTIDYKISIYPSIVVHPTDVVVSARIVLPDKNTLFVQSVEARDNLVYYGERMVKVFTENFVDQISREISLRLRDEVKQDINKQMKLDYGN